ncbi:hypothetical protein I3842_05G211900 [Carya illinoinensis]|uniref:Uncharacterized protein n=1 Tax=Carya illinoinensis TaxID=32201 RepID=A0A922F2B9_CARIL|nr:hypothetical protein I3842_05G211900 [Carya illinoinensis]
MAKMATTKATKFIVVAVLVAIFLLMSTEVATAALDASLTDQLKLGRRVLQTNTNGRGGYNSYNTTARGGYN